MRLFYKNLRRTQSDIETSLRSAENVYPADANSERKYLRPVATMTFHPVSLTKGEHGWMFTM
jgi:hypothetical protein